MNTMETPSRLLAKQILDRLIAEGLLVPERAKKIESKLAEGKLRSDDWRLAIESPELKTSKP